MPHRGNLILINDVIAACMDDIERRNLPVTTVMRRVFTLFDEGERDFETLKRAALGIEGEATTPEV